MKSLTCSNKPSLKQNQFDNEINNEKEGKIGAKCSLQTFDPLNGYGLATPSLKIEDQEFQGRSIQTCIKC